MKTCSTCKEEKPLTEFYVKYGDVRHSYCKSCFNVYCMQRWAKKKLKAIEYMGGECVDCGYSDHPEPFHFHHVRDKSATWKKMRLWSWENIKAELSKCELLCANCHTIRHSIH